MGGQGTGVWEVDVLLIAAAVLTALAVVWTKFLRPILHAARRVAGIADTLVDIADEFRPNHGTTIKDKFTAIARDVAEIKVAQTASAQAFGVHVDEDRAGFAAGRQSAAELAEGQARMQTSLGNLEQTLIPDTAAGVKERDGQ